MRFRVFGEFGGDEEVGDLFLGGEGAEVGDALDLLGGEGGLYGLPAGEVTGGALGAAVDVLLVGGAPVTGGWDGDGLGFFFLAGFLAGILEISVR